MKIIPLCCPCTKKGELIETINGYVCKNHACIHSKQEMAFPKVNSIPILISEIQTDTVCSIEAGKTYFKRPMAKYTKLKKIIVGESRTTKQNCKKFLEEVFKLTINPKILIIGGAEKGSGTDTLWNDLNIEIHSVDIYPTDTVDLVCDGHYLPLKRNYYDGVWIQAVLEHVVEPTVVVNEIYRVLKKNGIVYAETPFMQQVHEGAYDFTRYTVVGHRYLFKNFDLIDLGGNKGPEIVLAWSIRYFIWALTRSKKIARVLGLFFGLLMRPCEFFLSKKSMYDASSGVYFMGKKGINEKLTHKELIKLYEGQF